MFLQVEACLAAAELAHDPNIRTTYLNLADRWQKLAKQREELLAERKRCRTIQIRKSTKSSLRRLSNLPNRSSGIPTSCVNAY